MDLKNHSKLKVVGTLKRNQLLILFTQISNSKSNRAIWTWRIRDLININAPTNFNIGNVICHRNEWAQIMITAWTTHEFNLFLEISAENIKYIVQEISQGIFQDRKYDSKHKWKLLWSMELSIFSSSKMKCVTYCVASTWWSFLIYLVNNKTQLQKMLMNKPLIWACGCRLSVKRIMISITHSQNNTLKGKKLKSSYR